jgi:long-chain acyl-CoA synthetase
LSDAAPVHPATAARLRLAYIAAIFPIRDAGDPMNAPVPAPAGLPPFQAIPDLLRAHARARPEHPALRQGQHTLSWGELDARMDRVAAALQREGLGPGDAIAISGVNSLPYAWLFLGALRAGLAVAPLPTGSQPAQLAGMVADSGARLFFVDAQVPAIETKARRIRMDQPDELEAWLAPVGSQPAPVAIQPEWPFNIIYSSGTTGTPKGIVQAHGMRWAHVARADAYGYGPEAVALVATSLCSNTTLVCFFPCLAKGGTAV